MDLPEDQRLKDISPKAYEHPADRAATAALQQIPMMDTVVRRLIEFGERSIIQQLLASAVRLGPDQLPEVWASHRAALARLDIELRPGSVHVADAVHQRDGDRLQEADRGAQLGHGQPDGRARAAHRARRTRPATSCPTTCSTRRRCTSCCSSARGRCRALPFFAGLPLLAIRLALLEWFRAAELSCDRAATLVTRSPMTTCQTMMVMSAGAASRKLSLDAFVKQANEYVDWEPGWDKLMRFGRELTLTHPYPVRRVHELMKWVRSGDYDRIMAGEYVRRGTRADARAGGRRRRRVLRRQVPDDLQGRPATASARSATRRATPPTSCRTG